MPNGRRGEKRPAGIIGATIMVGRIAVGEIKGRRSEAPNRDKGGEVGGRRRALPLTKEPRSTISKEAARRWAAAGTSAQPK
jgi:hypothetical protein